MTIYLIVERINDCTEIRGAFKSRENAEKYIDGEDYLSIEEIEVSE
jgi:hypothetical protein